MTNTIEAPIKSINPALLKAEIDAAAGDAYQGYSIGKAWPGVIRLHFADGTPQATIDAALVAYAAHDSSVLTDEQQLQVKRIEAMGALESVDFLAVKQQIDAATSLADAKPILRQLLLLVYRTALAQGLTSAPPPEA